MILHHVHVLFPDGSSWDTFVEATDLEIEKIAERLAFYKDHGDVSDWRTLRVIREHDFDSLKRGLDQRVQGPPKKRKDTDWPYDWPRPGS